MTELLYFILGILFISIIFPVLDGLSNLALQLFEVWRGRLGIKITKLNNEIQNINEPQLPEPTTSQAIGFQIPDEEEDEGEYYSD